jgi:hypothetical protein
MASTHAWLTHGAGAPGDPLLTHNPLLHPLLCKLLDTEQPRLLWAGVVQAFPDKKPQVPFSPGPAPACGPRKSVRLTLVRQLQPQTWHRDGPSLFKGWSATRHHPTHCLNVFVPLVDVTVHNGPTEFVPG